MQNTDENCIRYLMREMEPSEEIEFERAMLKDENLLIEVESLRITHNHLQKLPLKSPPVQVSNLVMAKAAELAKKRRNRFLNPILNAKSGIAAAVALISIGLVWFNFTPPFNSGSNTNGVSLNQSSIISPWVDKNDVIRIEMRKNGVLNKLSDNEITNSYTKLKLVKQEIAPQTSPSTYILTGSSQNN